MKHKGLKRQGSLYVVIVLCAAAAAVFLPRLWSQAQDPFCQEHLRSFMENFNTTGYKHHLNSAIGNWPPGPITLPRLGANFAIAQPDPMGARIYVCDAGDFDGDGYPDLIGLDISGQHPNGSRPWRSRLVFLKNTYPEHGDAQVFTLDPSKTFDEFHTHTGPASITVGDYNGDGLLDFFYMRNSADEFGYTNFLAAIYINIGTTEDPVFRPHNISPNLDFTSRFQAAGIYINWAADHLFSVDIDNDGDIDILVISQDRIFLVRNPGPGNFHLENFEVAELNYDQRTGFTVGRGGSSIAAADFRNSGHIDIIGGTVNNIPYLVYYENDGAGYFTRKEIAIPDPSCTGTVATLAADFTNNGWPDIFAATDRWNAGNLARMWFLRNHGMKDVEVQEDVYNAVTGEWETVTVTVQEIDWEFMCLNDCQPILPPDHDVDMSAVLDYDQDGDYDVILADANHSGDYYLVINQLAEVFALYGRAQSTNVTESALDPRLHAITRVRVTRLIQGWRGPSSDGLTVELFFSNNGGASWEFYRRFEGAEIASASDLPWHEFNTFGTDLRWQVIMTAEEDEMEEYTGASFETPWIQEIELEYAYVERHEYSRASAAATVLTSEGQSKKLVVGASFIFPGWEGQLRAYNVEAVSFSPDPYSALVNLTSSNLESPDGRDLYLGTEIYWDAGRLLNDRSADDRTIYTAIRAGGDLDSPLVRTDFTRANADLLSPFLQDVNVDNAGLIDFVRGRGRPWKLGDINHSTPVVVGPPSGDPGYMKNGYDDFKTKPPAAHRPKVIYVGANDGMLHCFDISTGEELWGFIPYNLLPRLRDMWAVDAANNSRFFNRQAYVDGSPSVADVQIDGQWRTVLVSGQGPGWGSEMAGGKNYYFALDVTDPAKPTPLWEFTHANAGETWSVPAIERVNQRNVGDRWVAFMGSGYNNTSVTAGNRFYVVAVDDGSLLRVQSITGVNTWGDTFLNQKGYRYTNIFHAIPGSPTALDADQDGYVDYVYFGDLDGRIWRLDVTSNRPNQWNLAEIYQDWMNFPIISKPAVWIDPFAGNPVPRIYFGTGGDDLAPDGATYSFVALLDTGANNSNNPTIEWYLGDPAPLAFSPDLRVGELGTGSKVWADPVIANGIVYFSTLRGSIEAVNPCVNLGEAGRLYARYIRQTSSIPAGGTAFKSADQTPPEYLDLISKARRAVTLGEAQNIGGRTKREVYIQQYDSTIEMLAQPIGSLLRIKSWREVYRIIW